MDALAALMLQIEWGADEALSDAPVDRLATPVARAPASPAAQAAEAANTIEALQRTLADFAGCALARTATNLVFADGNAASGLVLVGEAPGAEEDREGRPFAGPAGQLLDRMLASVSLTRADLLMTTLVPWRPPGGRAPTESEVATCLPFLWRHLTLLRPRLVVTLGALPLRALTGRQDGIRKLRGRWLSITVPGLPDAVPMLPMLHPGYLLNTPSAKKDAWTDILALRKAVNALY